MRVFVTGGAGFVAGHLLQRLHEASAEVTAVDREVDVADADAISAAVRDARPQAILHLAAQSSVAESFQDPLACYRINYRGSANVLAAARKHAPQARVVLIGSSDCYGATPVSDRPLREDDALHPVSPYARSKAA